MVLSRFIGNNEIKAKNLNQLDLNEYYTKKRFKRILTLFILVICLVLTVFFTLMVGPVNIPPLTIFQILFNISPDSWPPGYATIVLDIRLPRILLAILVGSALAVAGTTMQAMFRNPMASPYILGISSGAAFGAALAFVIGLNALLGISGVTLMAFIFTLLTTYLVYTIAKGGERTSVETLLLTGIAVGSFFSALVSLLMYISGEKLSTIWFWLMGGLWASDWNKLLFTTPFIILGIAALFLVSRHLNLLLMGEETALNLGLEVETFKKIIIILASLITAAAVSVCGIIGFIGLIIPHIMRILVGPDHRILLPASCLVGGLFLVWVDTLARTIIAPVELPVGIITALFGAPFFLYLLRKKKKIVGW
ncbi:MAG: iron chelate uptake ABC transporter family permease subunit [Candidatus Helarchaeota archaeon]|nr:iron chelate uptake ABC transporter family permease subunit [Candidatus Helarchaeota archaeon]